MQVGFGSGVLMTCPSVATISPQRFGVLQDITLDISFTMKGLFGQKQFALAMARGQGKLTGKAKFAQIQGSILNQIMFGQTNATGVTVVALDEAHTIPAPSGPYTQTVTNSATFVDDLGVTMAGVPMVRIASAGTPTTGQYKFVAGVYTFAAADTGLVVLITYSYTKVTGFNTVVVNKLMGDCPTFAIYFYETFQSKEYCFKLPMCAGNKLSVPTKVEDYVIHEFDFEAWDDGAGNIMTVSTTE